MNQAPYGQPPPPQYPQQQGYPPQYGQGYPPPPQFQQRPPDDEGHLNIISICTFCYAGLVALGGLVVSIYLIIGIVIAGAAVSSSHGGPEAAMGGVFIVIGGIGMIFFFTKAALLVWSGLSMRKRTRPTLSFVVACISCLNIPLGTTLGVFTLIVLSRASVKALYAQRAAQLS